MIKKTVLFLSVFFTFLHCAYSQTTGRALFVSVIQEPSVFSSLDSINQLIYFSKKTKIQTLFVQIYRENKAWFPSLVGDSRPYQENQARLGFDPFKKLIEKAHEQGMEVHAWANLMSLGANDQSPLLQKYGPDILTRNSKDKQTLDDYKIDHQFFLEPGDERIQQELLTLVEEITTAYPNLDGIQFDYIRYPDWHPRYGYTSANMDRFQRATGQHADEQNDAWRQWKRDQVTSLLTKLIARARRTNPSIQVSTTGLVAYSRANLEAFQDWKTWLQKDLIDFVTLMCYSPSNRKLKNYIQDAQSTLGDLKKVNIAIGVYKLVHFPKALDRQWKTAETTGERNATLFHYGNFLENPILVRSLLQDSQK